MRLGGSAIRPAAPRGRPRAPFDEKGSKEFSDAVALLALEDVQLAVCAEIDYTDMSEAWWDSEDKRHYGTESRVVEIQDVVAAKVFVEVERVGRGSGSVLPGS